MNFDWGIFFSLTGLIVGLGAVLVIDCLGFFSRRDKVLTQVTIHAHHVTKPLIWIGTFFVLVGYGIGVFQNGFEGIFMWKGFLLGVMVLNGSFLSFWVSPRLDSLLGENVLLERGLQRRITFSFLVSFFSWWGFVILSVLQVS